MSSDDNVKKNLDEISKIREATNSNNFEDNDDDERFVIKETLDPALLDIETLEKKEEEPPKIDIEIL